MTPEIFARFSVCLEYLPHGTAPEWDDGCVRFYSVVLADIPDDAAPTLMKAVGSQFKFRPTPHEILDVWRKISRTSSDLTAEEMVGKMISLRCEKGIQHRKIQDDPCCRWEQCEPSWSNPLMARLSRAMGGWNEFCNDSSPLGVLRGQLRYAAESILAGVSEEGIERLRLDYQETRWMASEQDEMLPAAMLIEPP